MTCDLLLVWPPGLGSYAQINGVPSLVGYAESIGLRAEQIDAAVGFEHYLLSNKALDRHKPPPSSNPGLHACWKETRDTIRRHRKRAYRDGDIYSRDVCLTYSSWYYGNSLYIRFTRHCFP